MNQSSRASGSAEIRNWHAKQPLFPVGRGSVAFPQRLSRYEQHGHGRCVLVVDRELGAGIASSEGDDVLVVAATRS